jgi:pheromone shutdown-related protein TraB
MLESALAEINQSLPTVATVLIDERNQYLANKIKNAPGKKIIAVLGAAHVPGITKEIYLEQDMQELSSIPTKSLWSKLKGWIIPAIIISLILYSFLNSFQMGLSQLKSWILYNGTFSALGCLLLMAHPLTILTAFIVAPITSLNPLLAAGWFAGIVEAMIKKPTVADMQNVYRDITTLKGILSNRFIKILAIVIVANVFSTIATFISGMDIIERLWG